MKYSHRLSDAIHILTYIASRNVLVNDISSRAIASSINSNPSLIRRLMAQLKKADLLVSVPGKANVTLQRPATEISVLDVYRAIDEPTMFHVDPDTNERCPIGANIQPALTDIYQQIQKQAEKQMATITLDTIVQQINYQIHDTSI
jgi:DNA-binding IscR family transcriptional regulator